MLLLSGCSTKYKRISIGSDTLGEDLAMYINNNTSVMNEITANLPTQLPMYKISERSISQQEFELMLQQLGITNNTSSWYHLELEENEVNGTIAGINDPERGYFDSLNMTEEELEEMAWETLAKIPFLDGDYEYMGIKATQTVSSAVGERITRVGVSFRRLLGDVRVVGNDQCYLYFDGSGLVEIHLAAYNYEQIGTIDMVTLENAVAMIKTPDAFSIDADNSAQTMATADTLLVENVKLLLFNQFSNGCAILQPVYNFTGIATDINDVHAEFSSMVIAIPESYTYESE